MCKYIFLLLIGILSAQIQKNAVQPLDYNYEISQLARKMQDLLESGNAVHVDKLLVNPISEEKAKQSEVKTDQDGITAFDTVKTLDGFYITVTGIDSVSPTEAVVKLQIGFSSFGKGFYTERRITC